MKALIELVVEVIQCKRVLADRNETRHDSKPANVLSRGR